MTTASHPADGNRWLSLGAFTFLFLATSYQLLCARQDVTFLNEHVLRMDDAYYYFQAARNVADLGWVTFDGIHATSGIQVLWGAVLAVLAGFIDDRLAFVRAVLILSAVLNAVSGLMLFRLGRNLAGDAVGSVALILWSGFMLGLSPMMIGVEYPLQIAILLAVFSVWWTIHADPERGATSSRLQILGLLLTLNYWNRLDSASLSLMVALAVAWLLMTRRDAPKFARQVASLLVWPVAGAFGYLAICLTVAHTRMPISGLVKEYYAARHFEGYGRLTALAGHVLWWVSVEIRPMVDVVSSALLANHRPVVRPLPLAVLAAVGGATCWSAAQIVRERQLHDRRYHAMSFLALCWLFGAIHAASVVWTIGPFSHVTQHYYGWLLITWSLWSGLMIERLLATSRSTASWARPLAIALVTCLVAANSAIAWRTFAQPVDPSATLHNRRLPVIAWIDEHVPADARIGAWNAGQIGYFSKRTVVNLDGLANDGEYLEVIEHGSLADYLKRERITYLVDNDALDLTMPYRAEWDHTRFFHRTVPWAGLEKVYVEAGQSDPIMVLRIRD